MSKDPKEFTSLADYSQAHADEIPVPKDGEILTEQPLEQLADFESLDDFAKANPTLTAQAPPSPESATDFPLTPSDEAAPGGSGLELSGMQEQSPPPPPENSMQLDAQGLGDLLPTPEAPDSARSDFSGAVTGVTPEGVTSDPLGPTDVPAAPSVPMDLGGFEATAAPAQAPPSTGQGTGIYFAPDSPVETVESHPGVTRAFASVAASAPPPATSAQRALPVAPPVPAAYPFSVLIHGKLKSDEQTRLLDLLERENFGITPKDLETQLRGDRILLPRISEYAAVLVIQALRAADVVIQAGPSDEIFSTNDTREVASDPMLAPPDAPQGTTYDAEHPSEDLPITLDHHISGQGDVEEAIDVITASMGIKSMAIELRRSAEFNDAVEALKRELRRKAHRRGAWGITQFKLQIDRLDLPSHYRVSVMGTAVRPKAPIKTPS